MDDCLGTIWRAIKYTVAAIGGILAAGFLSYGVFLQLSGKSTGLTDDLIIAFGSLVACQSCIICTVMQRSDQQAKLLIDSMNSQITQLDETNAELEDRVLGLTKVQEDLTAAAQEFDTLMDQAERLYTERMTQYTLENKRLGINVDELAHQKDVLTEKCAQLADVESRLSKTQEKYREELGKIKAANDAAQAELAQVKMLAADSSTKIQQLEQLAEKQREQISSMTKQLENLNELQRKSVRMIQMLSLYGDECKTLGIGLKDISSDLRKTDQSLGLSAKEMADQLRALQTITDQLKQVARGRGIDEDDPDDYVSTESVETA